jgi:uncharacterized membrane protein HdeD (DUF308 family)
VIALIRARRSASWNYAIAGAISLVLAVVPLGEYSFSGLFWRLVLAGAVLVGGVALVAIAVYRVIPIWQSFGSKTA